MLFDLRSRGRRRTVQVVYLGLALLMGGGLILFGVGAGNGFGGILNAFSGSSSGTSAVSQQEKDALKATRLHPGDPQAWAQLVQARYTAAGQGSNYNPNVVDPATGSTGAYTASGKRELIGANQAWQHYVALTSKPDTDLAQLVARADDVTGNYAAEAAAWQVVTAANPTTATYYEYLAAAAYKAGDSHLGDLAASRAVSLTPKAQQATIRQQLDQIKHPTASTSSVGAGTASSSGAASSSSTGGASGAGAASSSATGSGTASKPSRTPAKH